jgi:glycosyltransferase involved in cell wall biosynthesis
MRILHVTPTYFPVKGGIETLVKRVSETLASWGHDITVLTSDFTSVDGYYQLGVERIKDRKLRINGVNIIRVPFGDWLYILGNNVVPLIGPRKIRTLIEYYCFKSCSQYFDSLIYKQIKFLKPDVVMATPHLLPNVRAVINAHRMTKFPLVLMPCLHEEDSSWPVYEMAKILKDADSVLAMTDYEAFRLITGYGVKKQNITVSGFGVDISVPLSERTITRGSNVLFLGRKVPGKGISFLLEAMKVVWERVPNVQLILAGARSPQTLAVDELIRKLPKEYQEKVCSFDNITEDEKGQLLQSCFCLVLPSKVESFGGVLLEAWAHKTAIITLDLPVFNSFVDKGHNGLLITPDSIDELANAILQLEQNREQAYELGLAGYEKVVSQFTWEQITNRHLLAYREAVR